MLQLAGVTSVAPAAALEAVRSNVAANIARGLPELEELPGFGHRRDAPIAIVAGGPTLNTTIGALRGFDQVMAAGSVHDHLVGLVPPRYAVVGDYQPEAALYLKTPADGCTYLIASQCAAPVFDALAGQRVTLWHAGGIELDWFEQHLARAGHSAAAVATKPLITWGDTVGLRAIAIARALGFEELHLFGFDSCLDPAGRHHAYGIEGGSAGAIEIRVGDPVRGRRFDVPCDLVRQVSEFARDCSALDLTVHGDGVLAEIVRCWRQAA